jgi:hypothetical protein
MSTHSTTSGKCSLKCLQTEVCSVVDITRHSIQQRPICWFLAKIRRRQATPRRSNGTIKEFQVVLWRQEPDTTGCNWNARIEYIGRKRAADSRDLTWWDVVPQMRERFNLR